MHEYTTQILIVGSGPAGLACAHTLNEAGYATLIVERDHFAAGVANWPVYMKLFSTRELVELPGVPFTIPEEKPDRRQFLRYLNFYAERTGLAVRLHHEVKTIEGADGAFVTRGFTRAGDPFAVASEKVVLATGAYDTPNALGVPGEELPHVSHYYRELNDYYGQKVLIVGGRHSAAETALELHRAGIDVTICHRGEALSNLKYWIQPDLENRIKEGGIKAHPSAHVREIRPTTVMIESAGRGVFEEPFDAVLALTGYHPNPDFLRGLGLEVDAARQQPVFDPETFESTRPGIYMIGVMLAGDISGAIFIENSRHHGQRVLGHLRGQVAKAE